MDDHCLFYGALYTTIALNGYTLMIRVYILDVVCVCVWMGRGMINIQCTYNVPTGQRNDQHTMYIQCTHCFP